MKWGYLSGTRVAATPLCIRISELEAATSEGRLAWVVKRRFRWIRKPVPETPLTALVVIVTIAWFFPVKIAPFILSDLLTPLQKHHDSLRPPISFMWVTRVMGIFNSLDLSNQCNVASISVTMKKRREK